IRTGRRRRRRHRNAGASRALAAAIASAQVHGMAPDLPALAAAAGCGALVGSIRQWHEQKSETETNVDFGGVRTHTLWALLGCLAAGFPWALPTVLALVGAQI